MPPRCDDRPSPDPLPLSGIRILDFSTLLPGPLATLFLADAGAEVIKAERPGTGDEMRGRIPKLGSDSAVFALLNRGKRSLVVDLKNDADRNALSDLVRTVDVVVEQFRPGVMARLGLNYERLTTFNPGLIYCSIVGYPSASASAHKAGHDLNYVADAGLLSAVPGRGGPPALPPALIGDIAGGTLPAVINILLALRQRDKTGKGCRVEVAMSENVRMFSYAAMAKGWAAGDWPEAGREATTGGSPRYAIYSAADDRYIAVAALEDRFWAQFCDAIGLAPALRERAAPVCAVREAVSAIIASRTSTDWERTFAGRDVCCSIVREVADVLGERDRDDLRAFQVSGSEEAMPALPLPIDPAFRRQGTLPYPALGADNDLLSRHE